jgi:hypothetical protein
MSRKTKTKAVKQATRKHTELLETYNEKKAERAFLLGLFFLMLFV